MLDQRRELGTVLSLRVGFGRTLWRLCKDWIEGRRPRFPRLALDWTPSTLDRMVDRHRADWTTDNIWANNQGKLECGKYDLITRYF